MNRHFRLWATLLFISTVVYASGPQANIEIPCPVTEKILRDGSIQAVDCNGKPVGTPTKAEVTTTPPKESVTPSDVRIPANSPAAVAYQDYLKAYYNYQTHSLTYAES